ncbi:MAG TPA: S41 family peptidase [Acidobacteriaceae bacterium]|jgi:carboxyl-terminal processing protease|nr:S41 family peptidase [Acidobacteriaceae bacterium]
MSIRTRRTLFSLVIFFAVCALGGMVLSQRLGAQSATDETTFRDGLKSFSSVYDIVAKNYAEPLTGDMPDKVIYDGAIPEMLHTLDPHSSFYDPKAYARMKEDQHGKYYGVGMYIQPLNGKVVVVYPIDGSPAFRAGIHPGDTISAIDGQSAAGLTSDDVANRLKGPRGTKVNVTMTRVGASAPLNFELTRDEIPNPSIDLSYYIRPGIGYIQIKQFQETTGREFDDAIDALGPNLKGLVLDLRGNPGGVLVEAVSVCDRLLKRGQVIVSQRGRAFPEQVYRATHGNDGENFPIVVLVNRGTASAAEIVSGALQDHDRALIAGETTFGKGLVQTVYTLSDNTGLALTTYHYYTPSGRLIQRNYNGVSLYDYYYNHEPPQSEKDREVRLTDSGRTVYGGGGITPDVKIQPPQSTPFQDLLLDRDAFQGFAEVYIGHHTIAKDFRVSDDVLTDFKQYLASQNYDYTPQEFATNLEWTKVNIKSKLDEIQFGYTQGLRVEADWDPEIQQAITFMPQAAQLEQHVQQVLAEKQAALTKGPGPQQ